MAGPIFICKTDRAGLTPLMAGGRPAFEHTAALHHGLVQRFGRDAGNLFAEPVVSADGTSISWYAEGTGEPQSLASLDPEMRRAPESVLRAQLEALAPALGDEELAPLLSRALYAASLDDILVLDGRPLITNWGFVPASVSIHDADALARHFTATLGRYASFPAPRLDGVISQARDSLPPPAASLPAAYPSGRAAAMPEHPGSAPLGDLRYWRGPLIAVVVAAVLLLYLSWPHVLRSWYGTDYSKALARAHELNNDLAAKIASVEKSLEAAACQGGDLNDPSLPPGDPNQIKPPESKLPAGMKPPKNLAEYLDSAVVLVVGEIKPGEYSLGSGFFIGERTIATNYHVTQGAKGIGVINTMLGKLTPVAVRAHTSGTAPQADFSILEIAADGPSGPPMALSASSERMEDIVIAGYPGITTQFDSRRARLLSGDISAIPQMSDSRGSITQSYPSEDPALIAVNTPISHGNSGGPLVDSCGRAIGMNTFGYEHDGDRAYFALSAAALMAFLDSVNVPYTKSADQCPPQSGADTQAPAAPTPHKMVPAAPGAGQ